MTSHYKVAAAEYIRTQAETEPVILVFYAQYGSRFRANQFLRSPQPMWPVGSVLTGMEGFLAEQRSFCSTPLDLYVKSFIAITKNSDTINLKPLIAHFILDSHDLGKNFFEKA